MTRKPMFDPRTVAREIPGIFDSIFPQLTPGVVAHLNRSAEHEQYEPVPEQLLESSKLQRAMLFELGFATGECLIRGEQIVWDECIEVATTRQQRHFDARAPEIVTNVDKEIAEIVGNNLFMMTSDLAKNRQSTLIIAPRIAGYQWIASGNGDFSAGASLIEVKCASRNFAAADYRQLVMYWLLSFASAIEDNSTEWAEGILLNPRSAKTVNFEFDDFLSVISAGRTKVEILQLFSSIVGTRNDFM